MLQPTNFAMNAGSAVRAGAEFGEYALPRLTAVAKVACAGGVLGLVTGLISGGVKCLALQKRGALDGAEAARVLGRDIATGVAAGTAASAASFYVSVAGTTVGAAISVPTWLPAAAAVAAAIGIGYVVTEASRQVLDRWIW